MVWLVVGIILGFIIGATTIEFLVPRVPRFFESLFNKLDTGGRKLDEILYYHIFNEATRNMRDRKWYQIRFPKFMTSAPLLIEAGINKGKVLEVGSGPGYLGLEWLNSTKNTELVGLDCSPEMVEIALRNASEYARKPTYVIGDAQSMQFADASFDSVFSSASLHEWNDPIAVFKEISRVLKPGGTYYIVDVRRDMSRHTRWLVLFTAWPSSVREYFVESMDKAYTTEEVKQLLATTSLAESSQIIKS